MFSGGNMVFWLALAAMIVVFVGAFFEFEDSIGFDDVIDYFMVTIFGTLFSVLAGAAVFFGGTGIANLALAHHDHYRTVSLVAIRDNAGDRRVVRVGIWGCGVVGELHVLLPGRRR